MNAREEKKGIGAWLAAKLLSPEEADKYNPNMPRDWFNSPKNLMDQLAPKGGLSYVAPPFSSYYDKIFGALPSPDLGKFRQIYRQVPEARRAVDIKIDMSLQSWSLEMPEGVPEEQGKEPLKYLNAWLDNVDFHTVLKQQLGDASVLGYTATEVVYDKESELEETVIKPEEYKEGPPLPQTFDPVKKLNPDAASSFEKHGIKAMVLKAPARHASVSVRELLAAQKTIKETDPEAKAEPAGVPVDLKVVDALFVRRRRDAVGNTYGFIQWLSWPPIVFDTTRMAMIVHRPMSWSYECAYGVSDYLSLIETQDKLWHLEADLMIVSHTNVAPMLHAKCGTPERPYSDAQISKVKTELANRGPAANIATKHDVDINPLQISTNVSAVMGYHKHLVEQRRILLGVPPGLLGVEVSSSYAKEAADVSTFKASLKCAQEELSNAYHDWIFPLILKPVFGDDCPIPYLRFNSAWDEDINAKAARVREDYKVGLIVKETALQEIGYAFDPDDPTLQEYYEAPQPLSPFGAPGMNSFQDGEKPQEGERDGDKPETSKDQKDRSEAPPKKQDMAPFKASKLSEDGKLLAELLALLRA